MIRCERHIHKVGTGSSGKRGTFVGRRDAVLERSLTVSVG